MKIFDKRPLSLILCIMLGGFVFSAIGSPALKISIVSISILLFLLSFFLRSFSKQSIILLRICAVSLILTSVLSFIYFDLWYNVKNRFKDEVYVSATVTELNLDGYSKSIDIKTESIDEKPLSKYKMRVIITDEDATNISIGSKVSFKAKISDFESYGEDYDAHLYYNSRGYAGIFVDVTDFQFIEPGEFTLSYKINAYRETLCRRIIYHSDAKIGGLLSALLFGERDFLSPEIKLNFSRIGISHILALSGMHLAFLCFGLNKLLSAFRINKKLRKAAEIIFIGAYIAFTGFSVSVMRAGFMLLASSLLFLLSRSHDSITSLFVALAVIVIAQPYSILDISLWLSAFATLGIVTMNESSRKRKDNRKIIKILCTLKDALMISVFAITSTLAISVSTFKELSLIAPISTLLFSLVTEIFMYVGTFFLIFCDIIPMGKIITLLGYVITESAEIISSLKWIFVSADFIAVEILIIVFSIIFFSFLIIDVKRKKLAIGLICSLFLSIFLTTALLSDINSKQTCYNYVRSDYDERIVMNFDGETTVIDITAANVSSSYESVSLLKNMKLTNAERYIYTRYSSSLVDSVEALLSSIIIDEIFIPLPTNEQEELIHNNFFGLSEDYRTKIIFYDTDEIIKTEDFAFFPVYYHSNTKTKNAFTILYNDNFYTYLSSGMLESTTISDALPLMDGCNTLILGKQGNGYSNYKFIYKIEDLENLIISSGGVTLPEETKDFYKDTEIYFSPEIIDLK